MALAMFPKAGGVRWKCRNYLTHIWLKIDSCMSSRQWKYLVILWLAITQKIPCISTNVVQDHMTTPFYRIKKPFIIYKAYRHMYMQNLDLLRCSVHACQAPLTVWIHTYDGTIYCLCTTFCHISNLVNYPTVHLADAVFPSNSNDVILLLSASFYKIYKQF